MARYIGKLQDGREVFAYDLQENEVVAQKDFEGKALGENELIMVGSTSLIDRDNEILDIEGWDLKNYKKNPVVLPSHMYWEPAIGKSKKTWIEDGKLKFHILFPDTGINPVADVYKGLYKGGFMTASSVGFNPYEWKWGEKPGEPRRTFMKQELLEISLVSVPANPEALLTEKAIQSAVDKGRLSSNDIKTLEDFLRRVYKESRDKAAGCFYIKPEGGGKSDEGLQDKGATGTEKNQGPAEEIKEEVKKKIQEIAAEAIKDFLKNHPSEVMETVKNIASAEVSRIIAEKSHYINRVLDSGDEKTLPEESDGLKQAISEGIQTAFKEKGKK